MRLGEALVENISCHCRTIPSQPLLITTATMGSRSSAAVGELLTGHLEAPVPVDADDRRIGPRGLCPDRGREAVAHGPEAA